MPAFPLEWSNGRGQSVRQPTTEWGAQVRADLLNFRTLFAIERAAPNPQRAIDAKVKDLIKNIGYHQSLRLTGENIQNALISFRSHFFSGPRRMLFQLRAAGPHVTERLVEKETATLVDDDLWKITAIWAFRVAAFVATARASPTIPPVQPLPPVPR